MRTLSFSLFYLLNFQPNQFGLSYQLTVTLTARAFQFLPSAVILAYLCEVSTDQQRYTVAQKGSDMLQRYAGKGDGSVVTRTTLSDLFDFGFMA